MILPEKKRGAIIPRAMNARSQTAGGKQITGCYYPLYDALFKQYT